MAKKLTQKDKQELETMLDYLDGGTAVLVSNGFYDRRMPTINEVGPGRTVSTPEACRHLGWGAFKCGEFGFSGGGAMYHSDTFSWTLLSGPTQTVYPFATAIDVIQKLINQYDRENQG